jgi:hypothetical protein
VNKDILLLSIYKEIYIIEGRKLEAKALKTNARVNPINQNEGILNHFCMSKSN